MSLIEYASRKIRRDTAGNWSSNNPTPLQGEWCLETDTGNVKIGDEITAWNDLGYYIPAKLAIPYDLTSANKTHTLPAITGAPQTESVYWTGGGTYKLTIEKDDGTPLDYNGEGKGHILVESDGSNWQVREYEDSGSNTDGDWKKELNGNMYCRIIGTKNNGLTTEQSFNIPKTYNTNPTVIVGNNSGYYGEIVRLGGSTPISTTAITVMVLDKDNASITASRNFAAELSGQWRT